MRRLGLGLVAVSRREEPPAGWPVVRTDCFVRREKWHAHRALWPLWWAYCRLGDLNLHLFHVMAECLWRHGRLDECEAFTWGDLARALVRPKKREEEKEANGG